MKKTLSFIGIILAFFIIYFLQINFFSWFNISGVKPNLFVILVLFIGLFMNKKIACIYGFIIGLYLDVLTGKQIGISAFTYALIGYLCGILDKSFSKENRINIIIMVICSTILYEVSVYLFYAITNKLPLQFLEFVKILSIETLFNAILTIILYPLIKFLGNKLENIFKRNGRIRSPYLLTK